MGCDVDNSEIRLFEIFGKRLHEEGLVHQGLIGQAFGKGFDFLVNAGKSKELFYMFHVIFL